MNDQTAHKARLAVAEVGRAVLLAGGTTGLVSILAGGLAPAWFNGLLFVLLLCLVLGTTWLARRDMAGRRELLLSQHVTPRGDECALRVGVLLSNPPIVTVPLPDDFVPLASYDETVEHIREHYTNYADLIRELPDCPADCPWPNRPQCGKRREVSEGLRDHADRRAAYRYDEWLWRPRRKVGDATYSPGFPRTSLLAIPLCDVDERGKQLLPTVRGYGELPDDFAELPTYRETEQYIREHFTNCEDLIRALPDCPADCPIAAVRGWPTGPQCGHHQAASDGFRVMTALFVIGVYERWRRRRGLSKG